MRWNFNVLGGFFWVTQANSPNHSDLITSIGLKIFHFRIQMSSPVPAEGDVRKGFHIETGTSWISSGTERSLCVLSLFDSFSAKCRISYASFQILLMWLRSGQIKMSTPASYIWFYWNLKDGSVDKMLDVEELLNRKQNSSEDNMVFTLNSYVGTLQPPSLVL